MVNNIKKLTVLDFREGKVYEYKLNKSKWVDPCDFIVAKGHKLKNCEWMVH